MGSGGELLGEEEAEVADVSEEGAGALLLGDESDGLEGVEEGGGLK